MANINNAAEKVYTLLVASLGLSGAKEALEVLNKMILDEEKRRNKLCQK